MTPVEPDLSRAPVSDAPPESADVDLAVARVEQEIRALFARIRVSWRESATIVHPDLQPLGYQVLASIADGKATSGGAIAEHLQTDKSAVSRQVRQLEELGLVESRPDPADGRARILVATDLARERIATARGRYQVRMTERLRHWSVADLERVSDLLEDLRR